MSELIADLRAVSDLKVWSLLVTLFGDAAIAQGARLSGPELREMLAPLEIKPDALRVALHRLRKEGWITAERQGRVGLYGLSEHGRAETHAVAARVYGGAKLAQGTWFLAVQQEDSPPPEQSLFLGFGRFLCPEAPPQPALSAPWSGPVPNWVMGRIIPPGLEDDFRALATILERAAPRPSAETGLVRLLILHHWRRLVLRTPPLAESLLGDDWAGGRCGVTVHEWLSRLPRPEFTGAA